MNHELASFVSMGLLKCIQRLEEPEIKDYVNHWKKNMRRSLSLAYQSAALFIHSFVPSMCKPEEATCGKPEEATCGKPEEATCGKPEEATFGKPEEADSKTDRKADNKTDTPVKA